MILSNEICIDPGTSLFLYSISDVYNHTWTFLTIRKIDKRDFEMICQMGYSSESFLYNAIAELNRLGYNPKMIDPVKLDYTGAVT